jgi:peptidoglycan endopeptidase LytF
VKKGDTLGHIAQAYKVGVGELAGTNRMDKNDVLVVGRVLKIPAGGRAPRGGVASTKRKIKYYTVVKGDYLGKIALKTKKKVSDLKKWNKLPNDKIFVGQKLALGPGGKAGARKRISVSKRPIPANGKHKVKPGQSISTIAYRYGLTTRDLKRLNGLTTDHIVPGQTLYLRGGAAKSSVSKARKKITGGGTLNGDKYVVKSGDSLWKIAKKFKVSSKNIMELNGLKDHFLMPGKTLLIPGRASSTGSASVGGDDTNRFVSKKNKPAPIVTKTTDKPQAAAPATSAKTWDPSKFTMLPHFVDQGADTIKGIAEMYGSKSEWIRNANPGIASDKELRTKKEIRVPVEELNIGKTGI